MATPTSPTVPSRADTIDDEAVPGEDSSEVTKLFNERLQAWKYAVGKLEDYISATEKTNHAHAKEYERVLKTVKDPLKHGHHFDQQLGGIAGMFENIRSNTQGMSKQHTETASILKGTILPIFERLHTEIKNKNKELMKGAGKGSKLVDKARAQTQKHIELLGSHTATFDSHGGKMNATDDPYVLQRGVLYRLDKQIQEENNNRQDMISVQNSFAQFEAHVIQTIQQGMGQFMQVMSTQADQKKAMYGDMVGNSQAIPLDFEWNGFVQRNNNILIDPSSPPRTVDSVHFPNQDHRSTQPIISGSLERKGKLLRGYDTNYYVVTPSKFLHEFKSDDNFAKDPSPELSLYLPDCVIGGVNDRKFNVKGKDVSKGKLLNKTSMSHEMQFKAHTPSAAQQWWEAIRAAAGQTTNEIPESSVPVSPATATGSPTSPQNGNAEKDLTLQTQGLDRQQTTGTIGSSTGTNQGSGPTPISAAPASGVPSEPGRYWMGRIPCFAAGRMRLHSTD